jgi:hypothetical protein
VHYATIPGVIAYRCTHRREARWLVKGLGHVRIGEADAGQGVVGDPAGPGLTLLGRTCPGCPDPFALGDVAILISQGPGVYVQDGVIAVHVECMAGTVAAAPSGVVHTEAERAVGVLGGPVAPVVAYLSGVR